MMDFLERHPAMMLGKPDFEKCTSFIDGVIYLREISVYNSFIKWLIEIQGAPANFGLGNQIRFLYSMGKLSNIKEETDSENLMGYLFLLWNEFLKLHNKRK